MENRVVLVSGGASGIGKASALAFSNLGINVAILDISEAAEETRDIIKNKNGNAIFIKADVTQYSDHLNVIDQIMKKFGRLDFVHNNAGIEQSPSNLIDVEEDQWDKIINVNLKGIWLAMKAQIPIMIKQKNGSIVNTSSIAALKGVETIGVYSAAKSGVISLSRVAAREYAKDNIRINAICPGLVMTEMSHRMKESNPDYFSKILEGIPLGYGCEPSEIANIAVWLSTNTNFITGQYIVADGGWLA